MTDYDIQSNIYDVRFVTDSKTYHAKAEAQPRNHSIPWNCPTFYDGCNCRTTVELFNLSLARNHDQFIMKHADLLEKEDTLRFLLEEAREEIQELKDELVAYKNGSQALSRKQ